MRRFFVEDSIEQDRPCIIKGSEARHMLKVLRMGPGDRCVLMDGCGALFLAVIQSATRQEVTVIPEKALPQLPHSPVGIILCQAVLKSGPMDYLIQKTSELGVDHIHPFSSLRSVIRPDREKAERKMRHWREIARNSAKQSGRIIPANIGGFSSFSQLTATWKEDEGIKAILWEEEGSRDLKGLLRGLLPADRFIGMVGPEGGFDRSEVSEAQDAGFEPVSLGSRILRAETAAIAMVTIVQYEWGDLCRA